jgi:diguanylate cyclase (GGDEF)-like protein
MPTTALAGPGSLTPSLLDARILLVDDDAAMVQALARLLSGYGQLRFATSGAQALIVAAGWVPELILLDAEMPGLSGFDVFRALQGDPRLADVPVIFVTQHREPEIETAVFELGAADFVTKPVAGPALRARVAMHLRLARMAQALAARPRQDALTGLASRPALEERLAEETVRAQRSGRALSLLLADIDHFGAYNETRGTAAGDDCLRALASLVHLLARRPGDLAARHGADAFALLLPDTDAAGAAAVAEGLGRGLDALDLPHPASPVASRVTASVGLSTLAAGAAAGTPPAHPGLLHQQAQQALQAAREAARASADRRAAVPSPTAPSN